jgi:hypothetical protein
MKKITFTADAGLIEQAHKVAHAQGKTLNTAFREWLGQFVQQAMGAQDYEILMKRLRHVRPGKRFTREEMNKR